MRFNLKWNVVFQAPDNLFDILSINCSEDALVRSTTFFCHLCSTVDALNLKLNDFLSNSGDCSIEKSIYNAIFIKDNGETLIGILDPLLVYRNVEISQKAARILNHLRNIRDDLSTADDGTMVVGERQEGIVDFNWKIIFLFFCKVYAYVRMLHLFFTRFIVPRLYLFVFHAQFGCFLLKDCVIFLQVQQPSLTFPFTQACIHF